MRRPLRLWAVMTAKSFADMDFTVRIPGCAAVDVRTTATTPGDPTHFLPLFASRTDAEVWSEGRFEVREIAEVEAALGEGGGGE